MTIYRCSIKFLTGADNGKELNFGVVFWKEKQKWRVCVKKYWNYFWCWKTFAMLVAQSKEKKVLSTRVLLGNHLRQIFFSIFISKMDFSLHGKKKNYRHKNYTFAKLKKYTVRITGHDCNSFSVLLAFTRKGNTIKDSTISLWLHGVQVINFLIISFNDS